MTSLSNISSDNRKYVLEKGMVTLTLGDEDAYVLGLYEEILVYFQDRT